MTTAQSPLRILKAQADKIAETMKRAERGEPINGDVGGKIAAARAEKDSMKTGVVMDDKILTIETTWATIRATSEAGISEYILKQMRGARDRADH